MSSVIRKDLTIERNARWLLKGFGRGRLMADSMIIFRGTTVSSKSSLLKDFMDHLCHSSFASTVQLNN